MSDVTCDVKGCTDDAVARLHDTDDPNDRGERCRVCLLFDLGIA